MSDPALRASAPALIPAAPPRTAPPPAATPRAPAAPLPGVVVPHKVPRRWPVVLIGIDKIVKAAGLVVVSFVLRALLHPEKHQQIDDWVNSARLEPHNYLINSILDVCEKAVGIQPKSLHLMHMGVIIYAGIYLIEGLGLLFDKKWAEWMVIIGTAGFLPFEIYEIYLELTWPRCLLFAINIVVFIYLCFRLRRLAVLKKEKAAGFPVVLPGEK